WNTGTSHRQRSNTERQRRVHWCRRRRANANGERPYRARQPRRAAQAGHVRGRDPAGTARIIRRRSRQRGDEHRNALRRLRRARQRHIRAPGGRHRREGGRLLRDPLRRAARRACRRGRELPRRFGVPSEIRALADEREPAMIDRIIRWCATSRGMVVVIVTVLVAIGVWSIQHIAIDALPDLSDTQVIIFSKWDRSPDIIEDQVTYPITTALPGAPHVKAIRGFSDFGYSYVYVIFDEGTDIYWARSRVLEYLSKVQPSQPQGVETSLGPDATGVGWVFQYALVDTTGRRSLADLRSLEDWHIRYELQSVPGVAEAASIGGFVRQYQITVDPQKLASYGIPLMQVSDAVRKSNNEVGGRLIEWSGAEYMVRAYGYVRSRSDLEQIVLKSANGTPVRLADVA